MNDWPVRVPLSPKGLRITMRKKKMRRDERRRGNGGKKKRIG